MTKAEKRESFKNFVRKIKTSEKENAKEATVLENYSSDVLVVDKSTGEKMILLSLTSTDGGDYYIAVNKYGNLSSDNVNKIKVVLTDEQKRLL